MAESLITKHLRDGTIRIVQGANSYTVRFEDGDLKLSIPGPVVEMYLDRNRIADVVGGEPSLRYGEEQPMSGSFSARLRDLGSNLILTASQFITQTGLVAASWGSTMGAAAEVKTYDLYWDVAGVIHGDPANRSMLLPYVTFSGDVEEGGPDKISFNFVSHCLYPVVQ